MWRLCEENGVQPTVANVENAWEMYVDQRLKDVRYSLSKQSPGQIKVLTLIASGLNQELTGQLAQKKVKMAAPSILSALRNLEENDYIEQTQAGTYRVIDPLIKDVLLKHEMGNIE